MLFLHICFIDIHLNEITSGELSSAVHSLYAMVGQSIIINIFISTVDHTTAYLNYLLKKKKNFDGLLPAVGQKSHHHLSPPLTALLHSSIFLSVCINLLSGQTLMPTAKPSLKKINILIKRFEPV